MFEISARTFSSQIGMYPRGYNCPESSVFCQISGPEGTWSKCIPRDTSGSKGLMYL